jgi:hypothetical protein
VKLTSRIHGAVAGVALALLTVAATDASALSISLDSCVSGDCSSFSGSVDLTLVDVGSDLQVTILNDTNGDVALLEMLFSGTVTTTSTVLSGGLAPSTTTYTPSGVLNGATMTVKTYSSLQTDAGFNYNVEVDLPPPPGQDTARLTSGESITFLIAGLSVTNLDLSLAHIISIDPGGDSAKVIAVPDGGTTLSLLGLSMLGLGLARRKLSL